MKRDEKDEKVEPAEYGLEAREFWKVIDPGDVKEASLKIAALELRVEMCECRLDELTSWFNSSREITGSVKVIPQR